MDSSRSRILVVCAIIVLLFLIVVGRLFQVQVLDGVRYSKMSRAQSTGRVILSATRGQILDRNGSCLARSVRGGVEVNAQMFAPSGDSLTPTKGKALTRRMYPYGTVAGTIVGWTGTDGSGLGGVEFAYDKYLRGEDGWEMVSRDNRNRHYARIGLPQQAPVGGADVTMTIDLEVQKIAEKVLSETVRKYGAKNGMCIVADPHTGRVLAMANYPDFNPNLWRSYEGERRGNHCIDRVYEPGSTFKVLTAAAALEEKAFTENDTIDANNGVFEIYGQKIRDHEPHGRISFAQALSYSSNVCFAKIATDLGNKRLYRYAIDFGMGSPTGLALPGEEGGIVHPVDKWSGRTLVTMAIGQEISTTLMQMVMAFSVIANGGILVEPVIVEKIEGRRAPDKSFFEPHAKRRVISSDAAARLRIMMADVVNYGTAKTISLSGMSVAGKTGTSQKIDPATGGYSRSKVWSSFIGFVPADNPMLVCGVMIDEPSIGEYGGTVAAPAFLQVVKQIASHPQLEFAERLLSMGIPDSLLSTVVSSAKVNKVPDLAGLDRETAAKMCSADNLTYEIAGTGRTIAFQTPPPGRPLLKGTRLILFTDGDKPDARAGTAPDCTGESLRDAVNLLRRGLFLWLVEPVR